MKNQFQTMFGLSLVQKKPFFQFSRFYSYLESLFGLSDLKKHLLFFRLPFAVEPKRKAVVDHPFVIRIFHAFVNVLERLNCHLVDGNEPDLIN